MTHAPIDDPALTVSADDGERARRWAEGLPFSTRRELRRGERSGWYRRVARLLARTVLGAVATLVVVGGAAVWIERDAAAVAHALGGFFGVALSLLGLVGLVGACLRWPHAPARRWPGVLGLVVLGVTVVATALAPPEALSSPWLRTPWVAIVLLGTGTVALATWQRLALLARLPRLLSDLSSADVEVYANASARLDVLPRSKIVIARNGSPAARIESTRTAEIAAPQPHAYRTSLPRGIIRATADADMRLQRRSLTVDERAELAAHIRRLRRAAWPALASIVAVALVLGGRMLGDPDWHNLVDAVALGWYALGVVAAVGYARRSSAARKLEVDRNLRWVVTVDDASRCSSEAARLEVLPVSHLAWTQDAAPASWRLHGA